MVSSRTEKKLMYYIKKAMSDYHMIQKGDRVMVCVSGGKDSYSLLNILNLIRTESNYKFDLFAFTLDQSQPGWNDTKMRYWMEQKRIPFEILTKDTYSIVREKTAAGKTYCSLCSRLRRGIIYRYAEENNFNKIALGHHRDDLIETLMLSVLYNGQICSMPPKLISDSKQHIVIRPMAYCQEKDIINYADEQRFPIIPCNLCGSQDNLMRQRVKVLIAQLAQENPKVPSNMLRALSNIRPSQLMDRELWDFKNLIAMNTSTESKLSSK